MNKEEKINYLINELISENSRYKNIEIPTDYDNKIRLLRSLMNIREPKPLKEEFLKIQNEFLQEKVK